MNNFFFNCYKEPAACSFLGMQMILLLRWSHLDKGAVSLWNKIPTFRTLYLLPSSRIIMKWTYYIDISDYRGRIFPLKSWQQPAKLVGGAARKFTILNLYCTFPIPDFVDRFLVNWLVNHVDKTTSEHECALRTVATENLKRKGFLYTLKDGAAISHMRSVPDAYLLG
jgi:hypothetical protein